VTSGGGAAYWLRRAAAASLGVDPAAFSATGDMLMCRLFIGADARLWRTRLKSVRMRGYSTSVRLENFYWRVLEEVARRDGMNVPQLLAKLHEELIEAHGEIDNFSSFLRVC